MKAQLREMMPSGLRLYLDGKPMHAGVPIEREFRDGTWVLGRYEYRFRSNYDRPTLEPLFYFDVHGEAACIELTLVDELRWPAREVVR